MCGSLAVAQPYNPPLNGISLYKSQGWYLNAQASIPNTVVVLQTMLNREYMPRPLMRPNIAFRTAISNGTVNITWIGTSISVGYNIAFANSAMQQFRQRLMSEIPQITWNITGMAISGTTMSNLAASTFTAPANFSFPVQSNVNQTVTSGMLWPFGSTNGVSWEDHVQYSLPDLVVIGDMGMNDAPNADLFMSSYTNFYAYTQTWSKKPWFVLGTTYLLTTNSNYSSPVYQYSLQAMADFFRWTAISNGFGLIDQNAWYVYERDGIRKEQTPFSTDSYMQSFPTNWSVLTGTVVATNLGAVFSSGASASFTNSFSRDVDLQSTWVTTNYNAQIGYSYRMTNSLDTLSGFTFFYVPESGISQLFNHSAVVYQSTNAVSPTNSLFSLRVKATGMRHEAWINNSNVMNYVPPVAPVVPGYAAIWVSTGPATATYVVLQTATNYVANVPSVTTPGIVPEGYLLGATNGTFPQLAEQSSPAMAGWSSGGNGINHLSDVGEFAVYNVAVAQFVEEFKRMLAVPLSRW